MNTHRNKFYITKYALSSGIIVKECNEPDEDGYLSAFGTWHTKGNWSRTFEGAQAQAEAMRIKKIASLKKQIAKLEAMRFDAPKEG